MKTEEMLEVLKDRLEDGQPLFRPGTAFVSHPLYGWLRLTKRNGELITCEEAGYLAKDWPNMNLIWMDDL